MGGTKLLLRLEQIQSSKRGWAKKVIKPTVRQKRMRKIKKMTFVVVVFVYWPEWLSLVVMLKTNQLGEE